MIVLGIESSCDETSVSIVKKRKIFGDILSEKTLSQINKHKVFGGVVPELASREHSESINMLTKEVLKEAKIDLNKIDGFAATTGPGLLGGLLVGCNYAKGLSITTGKPFLSINHLQAHVLIAKLNKKIDYPFFCLLVSGGHSLILLVKNYNNFQILGESIDDAVGEAFDKTAKVLGLSYPGGPEIEKLAKESNNKSVYKLPRPLIKDNSMNLSFSGLKTAVRRIVDLGISESEKSEIAYEFQLSITECLLKKVGLAIKKYKKKYKIKNFILTGGVASNTFIRSKFNLLCKENKINFFAPEKKLCTDNATMIAWAGIEKFYKTKKGDNLQLSPNPKWSLNKL